MTTHDAFDRDGAQRLCGELSRTIDGLSDVLDEEARLLRSARLEEAFAIADRKAELAETYMRYQETVRRRSGDLSRLAPVEIDSLRRQHEGLQERLAANLAALATAQHVAESLIRGAADAVHGSSGRSDGYTADARQANAYAAARPLTVNRAL